MLNLKGMVAGATRPLHGPLRNGSGIWIIFLLAGLYFGAAKLGLRMAIIHPSASPVWPPTGIALASVLLLGTRAGWGVFLGAFLANLTTYGTFWTSLGIASGNSLEALVGAYLVNRYASGRDAFAHPRDIFKFGLLGGGAATAVSATIGVTSLALGGFASWADFRVIWFTWWLGDGAGALIFVPLIVLWAKNHALPRDGQTLFERALFLLVLVLVSWVVFGGPFPFAYLTVPLLVWAAFRFELRETAAVIVLLTGIAIWATINELGPFVAATPNQSLLLLQAFMGIMMMVAMPLGSVVAERKAADQRVMAFQSQLQQQNFILEERVRESTNDLEVAYMEMLVRLAAAAEYRDDATGQHTRRVALISGILARDLGLPPVQVELIRWAAPLHDVGKIAIPDQILLKPGKLTPVEFEVMRTHATLGARILSGGKSALLKMAEEIALTHHERWDGTGYPRRLKGKAIPISGRIVAVADALDALISTRPYREARSVEEALHVIKDGAGTQFDPTVAITLLAHMHQSPADLVMAEARAVP